MYYMYMYMYYDVYFQIIFILIFLFVFRAKSGQKDTMGRIMHLTLEVHKVYLHLSSTVFMLNEMKVLNKQLWFTNLCKDLSFANIH